MARLVPQDQPESKPHVLRPRDDSGAAPGSAPFRAELDIAELDERGRPGPAWTARSTDIGRSHISFRSRRLCFAERRIIMCVHLVDDRPTPLCAEVAWSDYDADGQYLTRAMLMSMLDYPGVVDWFADRGARRGNAGRQ